MPPVFTPSASPPAAGLTEPGDIYVDLASRTTWLGVDEAVDPAGSVLIGDIDALLDYADQVLVEAKAYTDTQVATRSPVGHTHVAANVTDFTAAVQAVIAATPTAGIPSGVIAMWSGLMTEIGIGDLAGWVLCDGNNGTPDLRDKFVIGAGNLAVGATNPLANAVSSPAGAHTHTINGTVLTIAQVPAHTHSINIQNAPGTAASAGAHTHTVPVAGGVTRSPASNNPGSCIGTGGTDNDTGSAGAHTHSVTVDVVGNTGSQGSSQSHTHTASSVGDHTHTLTSAQLRDAAPYFALAFIMKL